MYALIVDAPEQEAPAAARFWSAALGVPARVDPAEPQFTSLVGAVDRLATVVQAVDAAPRMHIDIETDDVEAEVDRLVQLGATEVSRWLECHVLQAPGGHLVCVIPVHSDPHLFEATAQTWN